MNRRHKYFPLKCISNAKKINHYFFQEKNIGYEETPQKNKCDFRTYVYDSKQIQQESLLPMH